MGERVITGLLLTQLRRRALGVLGISVDYRVISQSFPAVITRLSTVNSRL